MKKRKKQKTSHSPAEPIEKVKSAEEEKVVPSPVNTHL
jgi:hypothetical protein